MLAHQVYYNYTTIGNTQPSFSFLKQDNEVIGVDLTHSKVNTVGKTLGVEINKETVQKPWKKHSPGIYW